MEIFQFFIANFLSSVIHFSGFYEDKQRERNRRLLIVGILLVGKKTAKYYACNFWATLL